MTTQQSIENRSTVVEHNLHAKRRTLLLLGGLLIGLATSLPFTMIWPEIRDAPVRNCLSGSETNPVEAIRFAGLILPLPCTVTLLFLQPVVWVSFLAAGTGFGLIARRLAARGSVRRLATLGGFSFLVLGYLGWMFVPRIRVPELPLFLASGVAEPFAVMVFLVAVSFALVLILELRPSGWLWRALTAAAVTAACHWLVMWFLLGHASMIWTQDPATPPFADQLPELGSGLGPMMTSTMNGNLVAGTVGGYVTLALLSYSGRRSP